MSAKKNLMTKEGHQRLLDKREEIKKKKETAWASVGEAAGPEGDWHDNAAYENARAEYDLYTHQLAEINARLENVVFIETTKENEVVEIGSTVTLEIDGQEETYQILGEPDSDPTKGRISHKSPIAQAILGRKPGEIIEVKTPAGVLKVKILAIKN